MQNHRLEIIETKTLLEGWSKVIHIVYRMLRSDGTWQSQDRDMLDRGDATTVLLCNRARRTVLLLRQPRIITAMRGYKSSETIEACSGAVEKGTPFECALREVEEEAGHRLTSLIPVAQVYASPGASLEIVHLFLGEYDECTRVSDGGGHHHEGEDISLLEVKIEQAMAWIADGTICDARSILVLQHAVISGVFGLVSASPLQANAPLAPQ